MNSGGRILVVRLGAMGDVLHALPAVASLRRSHPRSRLTWIVHPRWIPLLQGNPDVDETIAFDRRDWPTVRAAWRALRARRFDLAVDLQGLVQSALVATASRAERILGFADTAVREKPAAWFYSSTVKPKAVHVVDQNLDLVAAAGAVRPLHVFPLPDGEPEGELPREPFVLASPLAGWVSKQWPAAFYKELAARLKREYGLALVINGPATAAAECAAIEGAQFHSSGLPGLIHATRKAVAVIGVDSGPMHLAAALGKPGVAIFGPTDPARNGPYGGSLTVLRAPGAATTYKRETTISDSMRAITVEMVIDALRPQLAGQRAPQGPKGTIK
jgi:heptosyltransferase-1